MNTETRATIFKPKKILVTGASGFVGQRIAQCLNTSLSYEIMLASRSKKICKELPHDIQSKYFFHGDIDESTDFMQALQDQDVIIHTAGRAHVMNEKSADPLTEFRRINVHGTLNLAKQAILSGVKRFIFISSIKVNGESTSDNTMFSEKDIPKPQDAYGKSKLEAERGLFDLAENTDMELTVIRPPIIYGPGVKGNFDKLIKILLLGFPLPFGSVNNKRSMVALDNLVDLIETCIAHPNAGNNIFLVSDDEDISTKELLEKLANAFEVQLKTFSLPESLLRIAAIILNKKSVADRILNSQKIDIRKVKKLLNWKPIITIDSQLDALAKNYNHRIDGK